MFALILSGSVIQIEVAEFPVHPSFQWIDISSVVPTPKVGWSFNGVVFTPPPPPPLPESKIAKRLEFKSEAVARMAAQVPAWNSFARIDFLVSIVNLLDLTSITAAQSLARDIFIFARDTAIPRVNAAADQAALDAISPTSADPFGDGTLWPT